MTKLSIGIIAAMAGLSLSACDRPADKAARDGVTSPPPRIAVGPTPQEPPSAAQPAERDPAYKDPSVPANPPENRPSADPAESK